MKRFSKLLCFMVVLIAVMAAFCTTSFAVTEKYLIVDVTGVDNNTAINEIELFDSSNNKISYTVSAPDVFDATTNGLPYHWNASAWNKSGLNDNITEYVENVSTLLMHSNGGQSWARFVILTDASKEISKVRIWAGKAYIPASVAVYTASSYDYTTNIKGRNNTNLSLLGECSIKISYTESLANDIIAVPKISAPINLNAKPDNAKVDLSWDAVTNSTGYNVKRSITVGGPYTTIASNITGTKYSDATVANGTTYYYVVSAINAGGESLNSNEASATPTAPQQINQLKLVLEVKEEKQLSVSNELLDNTDMDWTSSFPTMATVDANGKLKALKPGNTVITCTNKDKSYAESINVLVVDLEYQLAVDLSIGGTCRLTIDDLTNTTNVTWSSYDPTIATVSSKGKVTAVSEGLTYIIASDKDGKEIGRIYIRVRQ
jgi:hypothetical protein